MPTHFLHKTYPLTTPQTLLISAGCNHSSQPTQTDDPDQIDAWGDYWDSLSTMLDIFGLTTPGPRYEIPR
jgi:hypothetical protein